MGRIYKFNNASDMIYLAKDVQTKIYWHNHFYVEDKSIDYMYFWEYCEQAILEGYTSIEVKGPNVKFLRE